MDALALLCTLHADGPATLKRLRRAQCDSLEAVIALDVERLTAILESTPAIAERFQREAQSLEKRVGASIIEREAPVVRRTPDAPGATPADVQKRRAIERVLETWRERDEAAELDAESSVIEPAPIQTDVAGPENSLKTGEREHCGAIEPELIDGLHAEASATLAQAGIHDVAALAACDALAIARTTGLAYTRLSRWRSLARRLPSAARALPSAVRAPNDLTRHSAAAKFDAARVRTTNSSTAASTTTWGARLATTSMDKFSRSERPIPPTAAIVSFEERSVVLAPVHEQAHEPAREPETAGGPFA